MILKAQQTRKRLRQTMLDQRAEANAAELAPERRFVLRYSAACDRRFITKV
jgi:hypothetical protein